MAHAAFEHLTSLLRVWNDGGLYGDPYWGVAVRWLNSEEVELELQQKPLTPAIYRAVMAACRRAGIKRIMLRRFPGGSTGPVVTRWLDVAKE